jgi:metallo-beta-lactamase class B
VQLHGNTYYVGTRGLAAILIASPEGHVLIDGGLPESAAHIIANVRALGFRVEDVKLILNSHAHYDHAGGIAALRRVSGAAVAASPAAAVALRAGMVGPDDPQHPSHANPGSIQVALPFPSVRDVRVFADGDTLQAGSTRIVAHFTGGHTPGGTSWSWRSCADQRCLDFVYADSQTPVSADNFKFTRSVTYPAVMQDFERGFVVLERLSCDVLVTPHPGASRLWERVEAPKAGVQLIDRDACRRYVTTARRQLAQRVARETGR